MLVCVEKDAGTPAHIWSGHLTKCQQVKDQNAVFEFTTNQWESYLKNRAIHTIKRTSLPLPPETLLQAVFKGELLTHQDVR